MAALSSDSLSDSAFNGTENSNKVATSFEEGSNNSKESIVSGTREHEAISSYSQSVDSSVISSQQVSAYLSKVCSPALPHLSEASGVRTSSVSISEGVVKTFSSTPGYLANRWNPANNASSTPASIQLNLPQITPTT